jgi:hypothetical protein
MPRRKLRTYRVASMSSSIDREKKCTGCDRLLHLSCYYAHSSGAGGVSASCKDCVREYNAKRREADESLAKRPRAVQTTLPEAAVPGEHLYIMSMSTDPDGLLHGFKVGRSGNPARRALELSASMPYHMRVLVTFDGQGYLEDLVHTTLASHRNTAGRGREWFHKSLPLIINAVACAMQARPLNVNAGGGVTTPRTTQQRLGTSWCGASVAGGAEEGSETHPETSRELCETERF